MAEDKAAKVFVDASMNRMFNPYHFTNLVKQSGMIGADAIGRAAVGWFMLNEIDFRYGIGDPVTGELASRIVHEVLNDYEEIPSYNPGRGFSGGGVDAVGTWSHYESKHSPSFIRRGVDE
jgi:hypothetical protein